RTTEFPPLSLHDALPIYGEGQDLRCCHLPSGFAQRRTPRSGREGSDRFCGLEPAATQKQKAGIAPGPRKSDVVRSLALRELERRSEEHTSELQSRENLVC